MNRKLLKSSLNLNRTLKFKNVNYLTINEYSTKELKGKVGVFKSIKDGMVYGFVGLLTAVGYYQSEDLIKYHLESDQTHLEDNNLTPFEQNIKDELNELPLIKQLNFKKNLLNLEPIKDVEGYTLINLLVPEKVQKLLINKNSLTQSTYRTMNRIPIPPQTYYNEKLKQTLEGGYLGSELSNDKGLIHEGIISTLLDESFAKLGYLTLRTPFMFTANLSVDIKGNLNQNCFYFIQTKIEPVDKNYKCKLSAKIFTKDFKLVAEANSLFIVPKYARFNLPKI